MLFMVIESFRNRGAREVYRRFDEQGRLMPPGLEYRGSWVAADLGRCFQLMECGDVALLHEWVAQWSDLIEFEIIPVTSGDVAAAALRRLDTQGEDA
ncbi:MAG: DUF3303 domain-containing protein [Alphaproteobacteria bacterium]|nr:DUF3303 domain-containing protein [Alphaproteobacteria bacterium]